MQSPTNTTAASLATQLQSPAKPHKVLRMVENDRTAGSMPVWEDADAAATIENTLSKAQATQPSSNFSEVLDNALGYNATAQGEAQTAAAEQEFGFGDLLDMINPLQHIPVVSYLYREFTGDSIRPIGQIVGGALFGGPLGAASGLVNTIVEHETGKDMTGNALALMLNGDMPSLKNQTPALEDVPEKRLGAAALALQNQETPPQLQQDQDLASTLLAFSDLKSDSTIQILRGKPEDEVKKENWLSRVPKREPITTL